VGPFWFCLHAQTRQLAEHGGNWIECVDQTVPQQTDSRYRNGCYRSRGMAESQKHAKRDDQLAIHDQGCTDKAEKALSNITCV